MAATPTTTQTNLGTCVFVVKAIWFVCDFPQEEARITSLVPDSSWLLTVTSIHPGVYVSDDQTCFMRVSFVNLPVNHEDVAKR
jgi:hypothetical protein